MTRRLWAIADLHVGHAANRAAVTAVRDHGDDWLIIAGDVGETGAELDWALAALSQKFARLFWTPGNHELWNRRGDPLGPGVGRYRRLVEICRRHGCRTPEDSFDVWPEADLLIAPVFTLYDYSFRPASVTQDQAVEWASASGVLCSDEALLDPFPYRSVVDWCADRVMWTEARLAAATRGRNGPAVLASHFPLRSEDAHLPAIPRFAIWCGTRATEDWPRRFGAAVCLHGHLHLRSQRAAQGCRFLEVSFGYPVKGAPPRDLAAALVLIAEGATLAAPAAPAVAQGAHA